LCSEPACTTSGANVKETVEVEVVWRCLGLVVLIWFFSLLPLSMAVSFEVSMEFKAQMLELWPIHPLAGGVCVHLWRSRCGSSNHFSRVRAQVAQAPRASCVGRVLLGLHLRWAC